MEGAELARYRYEPLKTKDTLTQLESLNLVMASADAAAAAEGARRDEAAPRLTFVGKGKSRSAQASR